MGQDNTLSFDEWKSVYGNTGDMNGYNAYRGVGTSGADTGFGMDWLNNNAKGIGTLANVGGLAMGAYDTFLGDSAKKNKLAIESLKLQNANTKQAMADRSTFNKNWANASNGLARTAVS